MAIRRYYITLFGANLDKLIFPKFNLDSLFDYLPTPEEIKLRFNKYEYSVFEYILYIAKITKTRVNQDQQAKFKTWFNTISDDSNFDRQ